MATFSYSYQDLVAAVERSWEELSPPPPSWITITTAGATATGTITLVLFYVME